MEESQNDIEKAKDSIVTATARGERAAEAAAEQARSAAGDVADTAKQAGEDLWVGSEEAVNEAEIAATEGWDNLASAVATLWTSALETGSNGWDVMREQIETRPVRSVVIALVAGFALARLFASRD